MQSIYTLGTSSASHTYGNVISYLRVMLEEIFPERFLNGVYCDSQIAWKTIKETLGNGDREFVKRHYPYMIIQPRLNDNDTGRYLYNTPLTKNMDNVQAGLTRNTLFPILVDAANGVELDYRLNRDIISFDIEIRLKSQAQQIDIYKNLENQLLWDQPYFHAAALESMIPRSMIAYMGKIRGIDIDQGSKDGENLVPLIMRYLNGHSRNPITYKVRNSTSVEEFFLYYDVNLLLTFSNLDRSDGMKRNSIDDYYSITFHVDAEFNLPGLYAIVGDNRRQFHGMKFDALVRNEGNYPGGQMIPIYTFTNLYRNFAMETEDGFQFYSSTIVTIDPEDKDQCDVIDLADVIPMDHMNVLRDYIHNGVNPETLFRFRLLADDRELPVNCRQTDYEWWTINWEANNLTIRKGDPKKTYRIIVYANMVMLNEKVSHYHESSKVDIPELKKN